MTLLGDVRASSVGGLRHQPHIRLGIDDGGNPLAHKRMIINTENTDLFLHDCLLRG